MFAQTSPWEELIETARRGPSAPELKDRIVKVLPNRTGNLVWGQDFLFVTESQSPATISIDQQPPVPMLQIPGSNSWMLLTKMRTGVTHQYQFYAAGKPLGARGDAGGYNPDSYQKPGGSRGKLSERQTIVSKIYDGMTSNFWVYASPGVDPNVPAPLMVWQDGQGLTGEYSGLRLFTVTENLIHQKLIPPMVHVLIQPGTGGEAEGTRMRSILYDTVSDRYGKYLIDEVLPAVEKDYKLRPDAYSRAIAGASSGAICAFNVAWYHTGQFSRVLSHIGSYVALQWRPDQHLDGGYIVSNKVRREPKKNIRVWLSDGMDDQETLAGSWPLNNILLANALKLKGNDFHFRFGEGMHAIAQGALDLPESLAWLWRDYDSAKASQTYEMEESERAKPPFRVRIANRDVW